MPEYKYVGDAGRVYPSLPAPANDPEPGVTYSLPRNPDDGRWEHKRAKKAAAKRAPKKAAPKPEPEAPAPDPEPQPDPEPATADETQE